MEKWELIKGDENSFAKVKIGIKNLELTSLGFKTDSLQKENEIGLLIAHAPEMLEMLQFFISDFDNGLIEDFQIVRDRFEQLIQKATTPCETK